MTASAAEREGALRPHLDQARQAVSQLQAAVKAAEEEAHAAYVRGDVPAGDSAHAQAGQLRRQLEQAEARLETFDHAARVIAEQRQRESLEVQLAAVNERHGEALAEAQRQAAEVRPALGAAKLALRRAQQAEDLARHLETERYELEVHLGRRERGKFRPVTNTVAAMVERSPYLAQLLANPEL